jgi:ubiquinone/menaquinone biosynthesis C-methylase UbiE
MATEQKAYKGMAMEGVIATWYAKNTGRDLRRFHAAARSLLDRVPPGGRILEVAPGPGYLAIELARAGRRVTAIDISKTFVGIIREKAREAGVAIDVRHGNASALPFPDGSFDFVVSMAAFKNFADPVGALNEIHRVLRGGGEASIYDLRKDASREDIDAEVRDMRLSAWNAFLTRSIFRFGLLKSAYARENLVAMVRESRFGRWEILPDGIGFELRLEKSE